jgi:hypothetical protein
LSTTARGVIDSNHTLASSEKEGKVPYRFAVHMCTITKPCSRYNLIVIQDRIALSIEGRILWRWSQKRLKAYAAGNPERAATAPEVEEAIRWPKRCWPTGYDTWKALVESVSRLLTMAATPPIVFQGIECMA